MMADNTAYYELERELIEAIRAAKPETIAALAASVRYDMNTGTVRQLAYRCGIVERRATAEA